MVHIDCVRFGEITIDGKTYYSDVRVFWDGKVEMRDKSHVFGVEEFTPLLEKNIEALVIGTGIHGVMKILPEVEEIAENKGVKVFCDVSERAADIFNGLVRDGKRAVAVIHTTC